MAIRRRLPLIGVTLFASAVGTIVVGTAGVMAADGKAPLIDRSNPSVGTLPRHRKTAEGLGYGRGYRGYDPVKPHYGAVAMTDPGGMSRARRPRGSTNGVPVFLYPLSIADSGEFGSADQEASLTRILAGSAVLGEHCATPVLACTLNDSSEVGSGCSCKVEDGKYRGYVAP